MITFKLDDKSAEAMVAVLNAIQPHADFAQAITEQYVIQTSVPAETLPAEVIKPVVTKKPVAVAVVGE